MVGIEFIKAGKATFTVEVPASFQTAADAKPHYTYKVVRWVATPGNYSVYLLTGPDNKKDYTYIATIFGTEVRTTSASKMKADALPVRLISRVVARLEAGEGSVIEQKGFRVMHAGCCGRCNRKLTVPASLDCGVGPECMKHVYGCAKV